VSISVTVTISTVYPGSSGGTIFLGQDVAGKRTRFVAGRGSIFRVPIVGEVWALKGVCRRHAKYGDQIYVEQAILVAPSGRLVVDFLVRHPAFNGLGIGKATARRLWEAFGPDLGAVLGQGDAEKLTGVVSAECGRKLVEVWCAVSEEAAIVAFLDHHGFDLHLANKIRTVWPHGTLAKLLENPYRMLAFAAWEKVDRMARSLGLADDDSAPEHRGGGSLPVSAARRQTYADGRGHAGRQCRRGSLLRGVECNRRHRSRAAGTRYRRRSARLPAGRRRRDGERCCGLFSRVARRHAWARAEYVLRQPLRYRCGVDREISEQHRDAAQSCAA
jgi:ribosomal protein S18 acetylase RimI-like enzyme